MRTLVVSDLHLGSRTDADLLRRPEVREALVEAVRGIDRLVLLGDALELRHGPPGEALQAAVPVLRDVGAALAADAEVVLVPGNHDHALAAPWLERLAAERPRGLRLEERTDAGASWLTAALGDALGPATLSVAYPGVWLREDVYATHGHYMDCHVTVPTFERLAAGAMMAWVTGPIPAAGSAAPGDYEAVLGPLFAWMHAVARSTRSGFGAGRQSASADAWRTLTTRGRRPLRARAMVAGFPVAVRALGRAGLGPLSADLKPSALRRTGLGSMAEVCRRLGVGARHVVFGHTHRGGPRPGDDIGEWQPPGAPQLWNTGSWVHEPVFVGTRGARSPYWPGGVVHLDADGPPRRQMLLDGLDPAALRRPSPR